MNKNFKKDDIVFMWNLYKGQIKHFNKDGTVLVGSPLTHRLYKIDLNNVFSVSEHGKNFFIGLL